MTDEKDNLIKKLQKKITSLETTLEIVSNYSEITERRMQEQFEIVSETIPIPMIIANENGDILYTNINAQKTFGYLANEFTKLNSVLLYENPENRNDLLNILSENDEITGFRTSAKKSSGLFFPVVFHSRKLVFYGQDSILTVVHDLTEVMKLENELRQAYKMESIGTLAGGIAHDFNNLLGIIIGNMELALDSIEEWNPALLNLEEIKKASLRASEVVKQLLHFTRKTEQSKKSTDIRVIVNESLRLLRSSIPSSIKIVYDNPVDFKTVNADPTQIHQVLINLCTNAAHAMEKNGGVLKIDLSEVYLDGMAVEKFQGIGPGHYIQMTISDNGKGIDTEYIDKIFDPYFTTKEIGKGTGMGLSIVMGIVKNHNGAISVKSEAGNGTTFRVLFPESEKKVFKKESVSVKMPTGNESILLIDDEESLVDIASRMLQKIGYKVETQTDPIKALDLYRLGHSRFDLIITDMTMPNLSGEQLIVEIIKINPKVPVIMCTGFSDKIDRERALEIGAHNYIEKPLDKIQLASIVRKTLDNVRALNG